MPQVVPGSVQRLPPVPPDALAAVMSGGVVLTTTVGAKPVHVPEPRPGAMPRGAGMVTWVPLTHALGQPTTLMTRTRESHVCPGRASEATAWRVPPSRI